MEEDCGEAVVMEKDASKKEKERRLDWGFWQAAGPRYTLAAVATGQMTMAQWQSHANVVLSIAALASEQGRSAWLGVIYDELMRHRIFPCRSLNVC